MKTGTAAESGQAGTSSIGGRPPSTRRLRAGFTLVELLMVICIIGILLGLLMSGIHAVKRVACRKEAELTIDNLTIGVINLKRNCMFETVLGAYTSGRTTAGGTLFEDARHDFTVGGVNAGCTVYILSGKSVGPRSVSAVADAHKLTLDGAPFAVGEINLEYYVVKSGGIDWPVVNVVKELAPANDAWAATFTPHINGRKMTYFDCKPSRIMTIAGVKQYMDPWGQPYFYRLRWLDLDKNGVSETLVEEVGSTGGDIRLNTEDDIFREVSRMRIGG
jgi:prepilin-type N-terminal cleavage/methylation domain-containing protein